jgi:hypothetical protein
VDSGEGTSARSHLDVNSQARGSAPHFVRMLENQVTNLGPALADNGVHGSVVPARLDAADGNLVEVYWSRRSCRR